MANEARPDILDRKATARIKNLLDSRGWRAAVWVAACVILLSGAYLLWDRTGIRHEEYSFFDATRQRRIDVDIAIRRDLAARRDVSEGKIPVAIINQGNTVRYTEYSFISNLLATKGFMAVSIQNDLSSDAPLMTKIGEPYVGRLPVYQRSVENIEYVLHQIPSIQPNADEKHLLMVGHSNGGDIAMYFAKAHPEVVRDVITLDNLRVPLSGPFKILSIRSKDPRFVADKDVVPSDEICEKTGITVVHTHFQHTDMSDRGPETVKDTIMHAVSKFLSANSMPQKQGPSPSQKFSHLVKVSERRLASLF